MRAFNKVEALKSFMTRHEASESTHGAEAFLALDGILEPDSPPARVWEDSSTVEQDKHWSVERQNDYKGKVYYVLTDGAYYICCDEKCSLKMAEQHCRYLNGEKL